MRTLIKNALLLAATASLLISCAGYFGQDGRRGVSSSLVDYLYPEGQVPPEHDKTTPNLHLPLTVGLAFVPSQQGTFFTLPEARKTQLLEEVKQRFVGLDYVKEIAIIPETYMRYSRGF